MLSDELDYIVLYKPKPQYLQLHVVPFFIAYFLWIATWFLHIGYEEYFEIGFIVLAVIAACQILTCLSCVWSVHIKCILTCTKVSTIKSAHLVKAVPTPNNGYPELVRLNCSNLENDSFITWFEFLKTKYIYDENKKNFRTIDFPIDYEFSYYLESKGITKEKELSEVTIQCGINKMDLAIPEFFTLFQERATAPFFVFQLFCVALWCLDDYWYYSLLTLVMLVLFEMTLVQQQIRNLSLIRQMGTKPYPMNVYRLRKWCKIDSDQLVAGDIVAVGKSIDSQLIPADLLLLRGQCIVDEAMLTGESVPQMKESVEFDEIHQRLSIDDHGKLHVLYAGTKIVQHTPPSKMNSSHIKAPEGNCTAFVLRTGFNTAQGKLLKTIMVGVKRVTANNLESFFFILFLLFFAIIAASYVWIEGSKNEARNKYKLFLECTLILTSVVPPELPIELSLAVNNSMMALIKLGIYCTEPFRIPFAGKIDFCCFDKTGTLTSDLFVVEGVAGIDDYRSITEIDDLPKECVDILATCHTLSQVDGTYIGDPLEKATISAINWSVTKNDVVTPKTRKGLLKPWKIIQRYYFSSSLKRMSVLASQDIENKIIATVKGAPEILRDMFESLPPYYNDCYKRLTSRGSRVLALGYKDIKGVKISDAKEMSRKEIECGLTFGGFLIISCPLKKDSKDVMKHIINSSHYVTMITGDNPLTACHVAKELSMVNSDHILILQKKEDNIFHWVSVDESIIIDDVANASNRLLFENDLCITGEAAAFLTTNHLSFFCKIVARVRVFARVSPKQKEQVINLLKDRGYVTLMCGDGTNDVGALKHAHCGVALLANPVVEKKKTKKDEKSLESSKPQVSKPQNSKFTIRNKGAPPPSESFKESNRKLKAHLDDMLKQMNEEENTIVKLGDASIASPFTSKLSSINSVSHIIKQGRCTLVTTLQMFKILALNALILAYGQSVLYLDGIKFSDTQATLQGLLLAGCFLFVSRSRPLKTLSCDRPLPNIFNLYTISTVLFQSMCHFASLIFLVSNAKRISGHKSGEFVDLEKEFQPNLVNSTVYLIDIAMQINTFAINYRGHPFMESLSENKALRNSFLISGGALFVLLTEFVPSFNEWFQLVPLSEDFRYMILGVVMTDFAFCWLIDRCLRFLFGKGFQKKI